HTTCPRCATHTTAPGTVPQVVACRRKASSACMRASICCLLPDHWRLTQHQLPTTYCHPHAKRQRQGLWTMVAGEAVEDRYPQIAQDVENDVFHTVGEMTVCLDALHTPEHQTAHPLQNPRQLK